MGGVAGGATGGEFGGVGVGEEGVEVMVGLRRCRQVACILRRCSLAERSARGHAW